MNSDEPRRELAEVLLGLSECPQDLTLNERAGTLLSMLGQHREALAYCHRAAEADPTSAGAWDTLATVAIDAREIRTAREALNRVVSLEPGRALAHARLAWVLNELHEPERALAQAEQALGMRLPNPVQATLHRMIAASYARLGHHDSALLEYRRAIDSDPNDADSHHSLGVEYCRRNDFHAAMPSLQQAVRLAPQHAETWYALGFAANRVGEYALAKQSLYKARELGRDDHETHNELSYSLRGLGEIEPAREHGLSALRSAPDDAAAAQMHTSLGYCEALMGNQSKARSHHEESVRLDPTNPVAQYNLGQSCLDLGDPEGGLPHLEVAVELDQADAGYRLALAQCYLESNQFKRAEPMLRALLSTEEHASAHALLASGLIDLGRADQALSVALTEVRDNPDSASGWAILARAFSAVGKATDARSALSRAQELDRGDPWVRWADDELAQ